MSGFLSQYRGGGGSQRRGIESFRVRLGGVPGDGKRWPVRLIIAARAFTIGLAYYTVLNIPGVTSAFIAILGSVLLFDTFIAMERLTKGLVDLKRVLRQILEQSAATGLVLLRSLLIGLLFGLLAKLGIPVFLTTVLTMGVAYTISEHTPGNMSAFVGLIGALAVYNKMLAVPDITDITNFYQTVIGIGWTTGSGTFLALIEGMAIGALTGSVTRVFLPRGYRSKHSPAYGLPLDLQPFREVIELERGRVTAHVVVSANSPFAHKSLAETDLLTKYESRILAIGRDGGKISLPKGSDSLYPGDSVFILAPVENLPEITRLLKGEHQQQGDNA